MRKLLSCYKNPLFIAGLAFRLILVFLVLPLPVGDWYAPFLASSVNSFSLDPWQEWINKGGTPIAFPYGYVMWLFLLPLTLLCITLSIPIAYGYGVSLIVADFGLLILLNQLLKTKENSLLIFYWLSPISLIASYWLGYNDIIPVFLLVGAIYALREWRLGISGVLLMAAISAKLTMALSIPFFLIYLFHNKSLNQLLLKFLRGLGVGFCIFFIPFFWSHAGLGMITSNPEVGKIYQISVSLVQSTVVYLVPLSYFFVLYAIWRVKRINFELFNSILGMSFLLVVLLVPVSPGWFVWILPLLVSYQISGDRVAIYITSVFSALYVFSAFLSNGSQIGINNTLFQNSHLISLVHTALIATGIMLVIRIWRENISRNDFFRLSRKPFVIGVAGDSGSGKDTFINAITALFGAHSVASISGDNYHLWDRHQPMWQVITHINPAANDLERFAKNLVSLIDGRSIQASHYDHHSGKMSKPFSVRSNDIIIASGLHALYLPILRKCYDLSIYLDINEDLRTYFKVCRDISNRGYTAEQALAALDKRKSDSEKFIRPQANYADLTLSLQPIGPVPSLFNTNELTPLRLKLIMKSRHGFNEQSLKSVLIGVCGLHVDMKTNNDGSEVELSIEGEPTPEDIKMATKLICPQIFEFLDLTPRWQSGTLGLMQLITLSHINQALTRRFI